MLILSTALMLLFVQTSYGQFIVGSKHDFSAAAWNLPAPDGGQICKVCHTPHNASTVAGIVPLWNRTLTAAVFTTYTNSTFQGSASITQPDGPSRMCLGCHDGTVALNAFGGAPAGVPVFITDPLYSPTVLLGTDLTNDHPVSFTFDAALATADGALFNPTTKLSGITPAGTIQTDMLFNNKLQCASCHNPHGMGNPKFLRKSNAGSALCLTCHNK